MALWNWCVPSSSDYSFLLLLYFTISFIYVVLQEKTLSTDELAEMPSCNLAETVHNKWLQASGNKGGDLYVATVDDYIRAFLQVVAYYQFLKGGIGGVGPSKEELKLRWVQCRAERTGDPTVLQKTFLDMPGAEDFCTREPHLEGAEVFGSQKRKSDTPIGTDSETHRLDTINFSCLRLGKRVTRSGAATLPTVIEEVSPSVQEVFSPVAAGFDFHRVLAIQESKVNEKLWHIARIPLTSAKCCWAQQAITKKKCTARIVVNGRSTPASTYTGVWHNVCLNCEQPMQFFFCTDDIERYVKGLRRKWVVPFSNNED